MNFIHLVFNAIKLTDKVLDVGGARQPFRRADFVIDIVPYEMRDIENSFLLELPEHFSKNSWICQNICDENKGLPFKDKEFDFAICGHVLEDIANPFYVIKELQRVAKRGYIEVPSRFYEQYPRFHKNRLCGDPHHRWIIDLRFNPDSNENELIFVFKNHNVHFCSEYRLKKPLWKLGKTHLNPNLAVLGMFWEGKFNAYEDSDAATNDCRDFMKQTISLSRMFGKRLWDQTEPLPVEFKEYPVFNGIKSVHELDSYIGRRIALIDVSGNAIMTPSGK
jgi:hypothetical protein